MAQRSRAAKSARGSPASRRTRWSSRRRSGRQSACRSRSMWNDGGWRIAALHDHAVAAAGPVVARRAIDVVALLRRGRAPAASTGNGSSVTGVVPILPGEERLVFLQRPARDRAFDERPRARPVRRRTSLARSGAVLRLVVHVLAAARRAADRRQSDEQRTASLVMPGSTSLISFAPRPCRNARVACAVELRIVRLRSPGRSLPGWRRARSVGTLNTG